MSSERHPPQAVRFSSVNQEIAPQQLEPEEALKDVRRLSSSTSDKVEELSPEAQEELRTLSKNLLKSCCQAKRLENFSFEPVSLPASRAPSPTSASRTQSVHSAYRPSPPTSTLHSPPLTPAGTSSHDGRTDTGPEQRKGDADPAMMTPQISPPHDPPPTSMDAVSNNTSREQPAQSGSPRESPRASTRPSSASDVTGVVEAHPRHPPTFTIGPTGDSLPTSRDISPSGSTGTRTPGHHSPGTSTPTYGRPFTPAGDRDDPYARSRRPPQPRNLDSLDARFVFNTRDRKHRHHSPSASSSSLPRSKGYASDKEEKRSSVLTSSKHDQRVSIDDTDSRSVLGGSKHHHGSMSELKRFFKLGGHKRKDKEKHKDSRPESPASSTKAAKSKADKSGTRTPPTQETVSVLPFADDHGLESKYGKFGKVLGSGAGGSVRLLKRSSDGVVFAVKQFRARHSYESERDYSKKVTAEFCIGSTLHHGNIIETMDLIKEKGNYYVVMEYGPYDLFAIVMTGKMSREEVACATLQIVNGVTYLHSMGLAHRDLKLDNVVVNEQGIMKIIDFGSAAVFRYPFENDIVLASGIVGSDPYLAPEVYDLQKYDPQPTDIWSLAIIFCCMTLRRFPWKAPRVSDNSYKLFVSPPNDGPKAITGGSKSTTDLQDTAGEGRRKIGAQSAPASRANSGEANEPHHHHHQRHSHGQKEAPHSDPPTNEYPSTGPAAANGQREQPQVIKGPWRLLRLLPRESRHIIGRMLEVDPKKRATLEEILEDKWIRNSQVCSQEEGGTIINAENHEHTLEPGAGSTSAPPTGQQQKK